MDKYKYFCEKCNYGTNIKHSMLQHNETQLHKTGEKKLTIYKCSLCAFVTVNKNNYLTHNLNNHSTKEERKEKFKYYCDKCDFGVFTESLYNNHLATNRHKRINNII